MDPPALPQKLVVEFIGTFFLAFTVGTAVTGAPQGFAPLAIGASLMVMIYAGGHISGAHYNPAVSFAVLLRGKLTPPELIRYWGAQIAGALAAAGVFLILKDRADADPVKNVGSAFIVELLFTFALAWVMLHVATSADTEGNSFFGLAIGFLVVAAGYGGGSTSGGAFNPAVGIGGIVMGLLDAGDIWIYILATLTGGGLAALAYNFVTTGRPTRGTEGSKRGPARPAAGR